MNAIEQAVAPLKQESIDAVVNRTRAIINNYIAKLEEANWDVNVVAPYPKSTMGRSSYLAAKMRYDFIHSFTRSVAASYRPGEPRFVYVDEELVARVLKTAADDAAASYDAYVSKLNAKIGAVDAAELTYVAGLWSESMLKVTKGEEVEFWHTRCITNFSKFGLPFNQWPTRQKTIKAKKSPSAKAAMAPEAPTKTGGFDRKAYMREYNARKRAERAAQ